MDRRRGFHCVRRGATKQSGGPAKPYSAGGVEERKLSIPSFALTNALRGRAMTFKDIAIRTIAFVVLTAASTAVMALPHLG